MKDKIIEEFARKLVSTRGTVYETCYKTKCDNCKFKAYKDGDSGFLCRDLWLATSLIEDKIENGTLIDLPCKVGDMVYSNERIMFEPVIVKVITTHQSMNLPVSYTVFATAKDGYGIYLSSENFNEDWFLTKTEAEKKLKELQNER